MGPTRQYVELPQHAHAGLHCLWESSQQEMVSAESLPGGGKERLRLCAFLLLHFEDEIFV